MEEQTSNQNKVDYTSTKDEKQIQTSYPSETIMPSIGLVKQVVSAKGELNPIHKREFSIVTGKAEATLGMKLSTCVQYGLLKLSFGKGYLPGDNYHKYTYEDQAIAQLLMFYTPPLYKRLIDDLNGKILPNENDFANHLKNNYALNPNSADKAARVFLENARNLNLIDINNRLRFILKDNGNGNSRAEQQVIQNEVADQAPQTPLNHTPPPPPTGLVRLPVHLPGEGERVAYFEYPKSLTKRDFKVIAKALTFVASSLITDEENEDYELIIDVKEKRDS